MSDKSLQERKREFLEQCCGGGGDMGGGPTMSMGDAGYQGDAPAQGPMAGFDPTLAPKRKKKITDVVKQLKL